MASPPALPREPAAASAAQPAFDPASFRCRLSVVVCGRNDDHGGGWLERFALFLDTLLEQADLFALDGELVVVEWNPPPGRRLADALPVAAGPRHFPIRFIEVPPALHARTARGERLPLLQMVAKNVGIRRARGEFVLATNPDLLWSDALAAFLARGPLLPSTLYRVERYDVEASVPRVRSRAARLAWCEEHVLRVHRRWGSLDLVAGERAGAGSGFEAARAAWERVARDLEPAARTPPRVLARAVRRAFAPAARLLARAIERGGQRLAGVREPHTNACGDFTLLARDAWLRLGGYAELPLWSLHLDALFCYVALAYGLRERVLAPPAKLYHLEHGRSWASLAPQQRVRVFVEHPWLDTALLGMLREQARRTGSPPPLNPPDWGLARERLRETWVVGGERFERVGEAPASGAQEHEGP